MVTAWEGIAYPYLDFAILFLSVQLAELGFLLIVIDGSDHDDDDDSDQNGNTLDPGDLGLRAFRNGVIPVDLLFRWVVNSIIFVDTKTNGYDCGDK